MDRLRCPSCASLRVAGDKLRYKCKACGFIHDSTLKTVLKSSPEVADRELVFKKDLEALVVKKSKYRSVIYK